MNLVTISALYCLGCSLSQSLYSFWAAEERERMNYNQPIAVRNSHYLVGVIHLIVLACSDWTDKMSQIGSIPIETMSISSSATLLSKFLLDLQNAEQLI